MTTIRDASAQDARAFAEIYNEAVRNTTAIWNDKEVDTANRAAWIAERHRLRYPVISAIAEDGEVLGYASYGPFRAFDGYRYSAELSIYVSSTARGQGIGRALLSALIERAKSAKIHVLIAAIEANNLTSIALHRKHGFEQVGLMPQVGQKFGRWLDLLLMQRQLDEGLPDDRS